MTDAFLLTRQWRERDDTQDLVFWAWTSEGPARIVIDDAESVFFVSQNNLQKVTSTIGRNIPFRHAPVKLQTYHLFEDIVACYFPSQRFLNIARSKLESAGITAYETDIRPTDRYLMERFVQGGVQIEGEAVSADGYVSYHNPKLVPAELQPELKIVSLDIETSYTEQILYSVGLYMADERCVFMVGDEADTGITTFLPDERAVIEAVNQWMASRDPDVIIGWSVVAFDLRFLQQRCEALGIEFAIGRAGETVRWREGANERAYALVPGRVVLDGIEMLRQATYSFESFSLENVSRELLGVGKKVEDVDNRAAEIQDMFHEDKHALAAYNLEDCRLVFEIFRVTGLMDFAVQRSALTGLDIDRMGGSVAAFDFLYLPRLHRAGLVAPVVAEAEAAMSPGGFVLNSRPGLYENVIVLDFKSLYPSIIRTFHVDPLAMVRAGEDAVPGFRGGKFSRTETILPRLIDELWQARDEAKQKGRTADQRAIKIIMNSFYGVLGTTACRFFDPRLASSITMRGHEILQTTRDLIEDYGFSVIYGDTDSVFVHLTASKDVLADGEALARYLNEWWTTHLADTYQIKSHLEIEFETWFERFVMPTVRGSEEGSKKRYAGMVRRGEKTELVFKGLETVRSDWSPLARSFQQELYRRVFMGEPVEAYVAETVQDVFAGEHDDKLILRRRLRRKLEDYTRNVPPHVKAARMERELRAQAQEESWLASGSRWVEYIMTVNGAEPARLRRSPVDYNFYVDRQLAPIADAILQFRDQSLASITDRQLGLF